MKTTGNPKLSKKEIEFLVVLTVLIGKKLTKRQKKIIFMMVAQPELSGSVRRLKCEYEKPGNISQLATYYLNFLTGMLADTLFTSIATLLGNAKTQVQTLADAESAALSRVPGKVQLRNTEFLKTEIIMDQVLSEVQKAGDADLPNAATIFATHQLKVREYSRSEIGELEVINGNGKFIVRCKRAGKKGSTAAYLWMISTDKNNWELGDFAKISKGEITTFREDPLRLGTLYYIKAMTDSSDGKSGWTQIVESYCI